MDNGSFRICVEKLQPRRIMMPLKTVMDVKKYLSEEAALIVKKK